MSTCGADGTHANPIFPYFSVQAARKNELGGLGTCVDGFVRPTAMSCDARYDQNIPATNATKMREESTYREDRSEIVDFTHFDDLIIACVSDSAVVANPGVGHYRMYASKVINAARCEGTHAIRIAHIQTHPVGAISAELIL
ncbi:hypothetical protein A7X94_09695 [Stenotrophomonas maltophilia]|nr:hypothetical protein VN11_20900 [Stenotrophomonas maltophilia]KDE88288.1 hypothetical protein DF40_007175 [Stenotrophomonas maltophilia M30]KOO85659.1 hypothetical protein VL21_04765 [Stenotrophomonas maltophilia]KZE54841.1 hypothetical protein AVW14_05735 [Stenotrophomonas maltophilia]OCK47355.1 hypothetical protein BA766_09510 [Stenotrophomonas maltophilia]